MARSPLTPGSSPGQALALSTEGRGDNGGAFRFRYFFSTARRAAYAGALHLWVPAYAGMTFARPVHPHPRFKSGAGSSPLPSRRGDATPLTAPLGSRLRGNDGVVRGNDGWGFAGEGGRLQCPASRGIPCGRFAAASPSLCERDGIV